MKFFGKIALSFCILIVVAYSLPVVLNPAEKVHQQPGFPNPEAGSDDTGKGYPLPVTGYEFYIGQPIEAYTAKHGEPLRKGTAYGGSEWWTFGDTAQDYIQVGVKDGLIRSLFILGDRIDTGMFTIGMNRDNILDEGYLAKDFHLSVGKQDYELEATEQQQMLTPLLQFENDSFLMLLFDVQTQTVYGMYFLSNEALMDMEYYPVSSDEKYDAQKQEWLRDAASDAENALQIKAVLSVMRTHHGVAPLLDNEELQAVADQVIPRDEEINDFTAKFTLSEQRISNKISELLPDKTVYFLFNEPFYDVPQLFISLMQHEKIYPLIQDERLKNSAVACNRQYQLIVFGGQPE